MSVYLEDLAHSVRTVRSVEAVQARRLSPDAMDQDPQLQALLIAGGLAAGTDAQVTRRRRECSQALSTQPHKQRVQLDLGGLVMANIEITD